MSDIPPPPPYPPPPPPEPPQAAFLVSSEPTPPPRPSRGPVIVLALLAVAIVACLAVAVPMMVSDDGPPADLSAVRSYDDLAVVHTDDDVDYPQSPAVGGQHDPEWLECGAYDEPVREENAVHDLEHGAVWISYDPDLDADDVAELEDELPQNGIMAPYPGLSAPVVVTVWGRQLDLDGADDARLPMFVQRYGGGETAPEPFMSCAGGLTDPEGGGGSGSGASI